LLFIDKKQTTLLYIGKKKKNRCKACYTMFRIMGRDMLQVLTILGFTTCKGPPLKPFDKLLVVLPSKR
jgi:hypothetical protein